MASPQGEQPAAVFYPFGHPTPYAYASKPSIMGQGKLTSEKEKKGNLDHKSTKSVVSLCAAIPCPARKREKR
jgi:hypothetical protein